PDDAIPGDLLDGLAARKARGQQRHAVPAPAEMAQDLLHVHLGAAAERVREVPPIERDDVHAARLSCGPRHLQTPVLQSRRLTRQWRGMAFAFRRLSVLVPVFNEAATIRTLLARVMEVPIPKEIIVVDDYSTDGTREILAEFR